MCSPVLSHVSVPELPVFTVYCGRTDMHSMIACISASLSAWPNPLCGKPKLP